MACPRCGAANRPGAAFCDACGTPLAGPTAVAPAAAPKSCSQCGNPNAAGAWVCASCGASLAPGGAGSRGLTNTAGQLAVGSWFLGCLSAGIIGLLAAISLFLMGLRGDAAAFGILSAAGWVGAVLIAKYGM